MNVIQQDITEGSFTCPYDIPLRRYASGEPIKLLTLNTAFLPKIIGGISAATRHFGNNDKRIQKIASSIHDQDYDIICFQEMFREDLLPKLYESLGVKIVESNTQEVERCRQQLDHERDFSPLKMHYYGVHLPSPKRSTASSGLVVLSKFPVLSAKQIEFVDRGVGTDMASRKGFTEVLLNIHGQRFRLFNTHTQANADKSPLWWPFLVRGRTVKQTMACREQQLGQLAVRVEQALPHSDYVMICGDFNVKSGTPEFYKTMNTLKNPCDIVRDYCQQTDTRTSTSFRLDYVLSYNLPQSVTQLPKQLTIDSAVVNNYNKSPQEQETGHSKHRLSDHSGVSVAFRLS